MRLRRSWGTLFLGTRFQGRPVFLRFVKRLAFDDFAGLDAAGADADALASAVDLGLDWLEVHVPATAGGVVGVRDVVAELRAFAAKITFVCHDLLQS